AVPQPPAAGDALVIDGERRVRLPAVWDGDRVTIGVPIFNTRITATRDAASRSLIGDWEVESIFSGNFKRTFRAEPHEPDAAARVDVGDAPPLDLREATTVWRATFSGSGEGKLELEQPSPGVLHLTVTLATGNVMYLSGNARGDAFRLTGFDGYSTYLVTGTVARDRKKLTASWSAGPKLEWRESITAQRSKPFDLPIAFRAEAGGPADFLPQREKYAGKPLVVSLSATWCSSCFNANPVLRELQAAHEKDGLQIVTLLYEMTDDPALDREKAVAYKRDHHLTWDVIPVTGPIARAADLLPSALEEVDLSAFPLAIFVGRDGVVRGAQAGFPGPESREAYARTVAAYQAGVAALVAAK
ncbi:MAG TPA: TlpA disulfide reductase family protein, partial [Kofleriaceae bacterium]|nr:TlpA disulfide reductase family protein [Kofleriaceae bacterium]